jgi:rhamnosyltransferase
MTNVIVIATCNGGTFLREQLDSIVPQLPQEDWMLLVRDDVSDDGTMEMLRAYSARLKDRLKAVGGGERLGAKGNFGELLRYAYKCNAQYCFLADQDDIWRRDKIGLQMDFMRKLSRRNPHTPLLIHSDMEVVDVGLRRLHRSFMRYQGIRHEDGDPLQVLLAQNFVTGCTVMINRALLEVAVPIPEEALMHDWWLALCAASLGHIVYVDKPLVRYRQHRKNAVGAKRLLDSLNPLETNWFRHWSAGRRNLQRSMAQAQTLSRRIRAHDTSNPNLERIERYASLPGLAPLQRLRALRELGVHAQSQTRHALLLSRLLSLSRTKYG